jgi:hypothetical protein
LLEGFKVGGRHFGGLLGLLGLLVGLSALGILIWLVGMGWPWAIVIAVLLLLTIFLEGAYRVWDRTEMVARHFYPSWELLAERADTIQSVVDAAELPGGEAGRVQFRSQWIGGHRNAALRDYDRAEAAGFGLDLSRAALETAELADAPSIIAAFRSAVARWREAEASPTAR